MSICKNETCEKHANYGYDNKRHYCKEHKEDDMIGHKDKKCIHNRQKNKCRECNGSSFCIHDKIKSNCKECGGGSICIHNKRKTYCKECGGGAICIHDKIKSNCKECGGGAFCIHDKIKTRCKECNGGSICIHDKIKYLCKNCSPEQCLINLQRLSIRRMLKSSTLKKVKHTVEYLGCDSEYFQDYLKNKMVDGMTFDNIHIDHIKPMSRFNLNNPDEFLDCCHYTNLQPLTAKQNMEKSNKWSELNELFWQENIKGQEYDKIY